MYLKLFLPAVLLLASGISSARGQGDIESKTISHVFFKKRNDLISHLFLPAAKPSGHRKVRVVVVVVVVGGGTTLRS